MFTDDLSRAKWTQAAREAYHKSHPENFAGPDMSFPIKDGSDIDDAWRLAGHAADPEAVRAKIKAIATRLGLSSSLPDTAKDDKERTMPPKTISTEEPVTIDRAGNHAPMSGTHTHAHPAFGSQGDDAAHEHEHSHDNDADHHHSHGEERAETGVIQSSDRPQMYAPFMRIDAAKREVWGQATAEVPDSYKTIFAYYPDAWKQWRGNIREQHDAKKAVGKRVALECDDHARAVYVGSRISRGAQDTWLKVEDNVLTGYSVSIIPDPEFGNDPKRWPKKMYEGKEYAYLPRYSIAELSLVDNPACPGCDIQIVRADGFVTDVTEEPEQDTPKPEQPVERAGARVSADTKNKMHQSIAHTLHAAVSQMQNCGCDNCMAAQKMIDPDGDGDIDIGSFDDPDQDAADLYNGRDGEMDRAIAATIERVLTEKLAPVYQRLQGIAGTFARSNGAPTELTTLIDSSITRAMQTLDARMADLPSKASLDEVRADLSAVKGQVVKIAETPVPGAPVQYAAATRPPQAVEKRLPTDPYQQPARSGSSVYDALRQLSASGAFDTPDKQTDALAAGLIAQRQGR